MGGFRLTMDSFSYVLDLFFFFNQSTTFEVAEPNGTRAFNDIAAVIKNGTSERTVVVNVNAENNTALQGKKNVCND